jgi:Skp family chaperone for outer membrane proteins
MRRALVAATLGGLLLLGAGCSGGDEADTASEAPLDTPTAAATTTSPPPDYSANTKAVCTKLDKIFDTEIKSLGSELGKMIAYKEAKQDDEVETAQKAAAKQLKDIGAQVRKESAAAQDPDIKQAAEQSATKFSKTAADDAFFDKIKTMKDLEKVLNTQMTNWLNPVVGLCA